MGKANLGEVSNGDVGTEGMVWSGLGIVVESGLVLDSDGVELSCLGEIVGITEKVFDELSVLELELEGSGWVKGSWNLTDLLSGARIGTDGV